MKPCDQPMKRVYETRKRALRAAAMGRRKRGVDLTPYRCPSCRQWHLTSHPRTQWSI